MSRAAVGTSGVLEIIKPKWADEHDEEHVYPLEELYYAWASPEVKKLKERIAGVMASTCLAVKSGMEYIKGEEIRVSEEVRKGKFMKSLRAASDCLKIRKEYEDNLVDFCDKFSKTINTAEKINMLPERLHMDDMELLIRLSQERPFDRFTGVFQNPKRRKERVLIMNSCLDPTAVFYERVSLAFALGIKEITEIHRELIKHKIRFDSQVFSEPLNKN